jgi:hypothetical protein
MPELIQLPDTQSEFKNLKPMLEKQGYELSRTGNFFGITKQQVRLIDVFIISPFLFYASTKTDNKVVKYSLIALGVSTLIYNGYNYLKNR